MIQIIGLIVASYVLTRSVEIASSSVAKHVKLLAMLSAAVAVLGAVALLLSPGQQ